MVEWSHKLSCNVNDILDIGNRPIAYIATVLCGRIPELPSLSCLVHPRPALTTPK
jgi:hypothetical protein